MDPIPVGEKAPRFHLPATYSRIMDTRDFQGKKNLVLIFCHPADGSDENTAYLGQVRERAAEIKATDTEIIGISPSNQRFQSIFVYRNNLPFAFLIDEANSCAEDFHALAEDGSIAPTTYVVDKEYIIRMAERGYPEVSLILKALEGAPAE
ncbi:MAG: peroxiredoxin family protein [Candidatus Thermoplasmatota archaeon]|nr:peroxiredoxin family protein [Candidatus Thermoplasmatota archaeon]